jgi:hypothetical protein
LIAAVFIRGDSRHSREKSRAQLPSLPGAARPIRLFFFAREWRESARIRRRGGPDWARLCRLIAAAFIRGDSRHSREKSRAQLPSLPGAAGRNREPDA